MLGKCEKGNSNSNADLTTQESRNRCFYEPVRLIQKERKKQHAEHYTYYIHFPKHTHIIKQIEIYLLGELDLWFDYF